MDVDRDRSFLNLSDGKLLTNDGHTFQIHKMVLARISEYFRAMFCEASCDKTEFTIPGVSGECLGNILSYINSGNICVTEENVAELLIAANKLLLGNLCQEIKRYCLNNNPEVNCLKILKAAKEISNEEIYEDCIRVIETRFEWIMRCSENDKLGDLSFKILEKILRSRSLYVFSERTVWRAIVEWIQKKFPYRLTFLPRLLLCLAMSEMEEELAAEILQHEIFKKSDTLLVILDKVKSSNPSINDLQIFSKLCSRLSRIFEPLHSRFPKNINIVHLHSNLYATYDENFDLWNKILKLDFQPDFLTVIGHKMFIFKLGNRIICKKFNLRRMEWGESSGRRVLLRRAFFGTIDHFIYVIGVLGLIGNEAYHVEKYDTKNDRWYNISSFGEISKGNAASIKKNIYVVGNHHNSSATTMMCVLDSMTTQWSLLVSPNMNRSVEFALVEYHQKIYLIGGTDEGENIEKAEVYNPVTNLWKALPDIPHSYRSIKAKVMNDRILVYETELSEDNSPKIFQWNVEKVRWEQLEEISHLQDFLLHSLFCSFEDAETIKMMTRRNRDPNLILKKTHLKIHC